MCDRVENLDLLGIHDPPSESPISEAEKLLAVRDLTGRTAEDLEKYFATHPRLRRMP